MRYIIVASILFLSSFHAVLLSAKDAVVETHTGDSAPIAASAPDSMYIAELKFEKDPFQIVEDTILPPCDILFFKSGKIDYCKIVEVSPTSITYKMCDYVDGPNLVVNKSTVKKIRYANGKEELIVTEQQPQQQASPNAYARPTKDKTGKLALIFSLCSLLISILAIPGLILGIISLSKIQRSKGALIGKGTAIWAICISLLIIILFIATV